MYARSTTIHGNPQNLDEGIAFVRDTVMPAVQELDGCVGLSMLCDRDSGRCITTTAWADAEAMRRIADRVRDIRARAAEILGGVAEVDEWEIALLHRMDEAPRVPVAGLSGGAVTRRRRTTGSARSAWPCCRGSTSWPASAASACWSTDRAAGA